MSIHWDIARIATASVLDREAYAEAARAWGKHTDDKWVPGDRVNHHAAWDATITALTAYQKHLDAAPAKTTTRMMVVPSQTATIEIVVDGKWQPGWGMTIRKGDRLIVSHLDSGIVAVDLERPCGMASTPADRDFFVSG